jgi:quinol-cytochrome oxidoreductase complex cytochrome b subunit
MVLIVTLHMVRTFLTASYKKPRQFTWATGIVLLLATLFLSFSGYLLPWDQLALWAVTIGASMAEAVPPEIVGTNVNLLLRGGPDIGANGLLRFYLLHVLLVPALLFIFTGVHYYKVIIHAHSLPPKLENIGEDTAKRVPLDKRVYFIPDILTSELMWIAVTTLILTILCTWFYHAPLEQHADPQVTPLGTTAPWYFLWIQGALKLGDKTFWGVIFPGIVFNTLIILPYLDTGISRRFADRRFMLTVGFVLMSGTAILSYMGLPEFGVKAAAETEILHELTQPPAHNHMGKLLPIPFDQLVVGAYTTRQVEAVQAGEDPAAAVAAFNEELNAPTLDTNLGDTSLQTLLRNRLVLTDHLSFAGDFRFTPVPADAPELYEALAFFEHALEQNAAELPNATGILVITQNQDNLKRVDAVITWPTTVETAESQGLVPASVLAAMATEEATAGPDATEEAIAPSDTIQRLQADHLFIHQDAQYFAAPGE